MMTMPYPFAQTAAEALLPAAIIVDVDGTVALHDGRSPFDWDRVLEDRPNYPVIFVVRTLIQAGLRGLFVSGRQDVCREDTELWLKLHVDVPYDMLLMRSASDPSRPDFQVKLDLYREHIEGKYRILGVFDDRNQVVQVWRKDLGLTVFQVADGDF